MTTPKIALIWAEASGGVIGKAGTIPWYLPEDFAHFKELTLGGTVIMGRKTWDSLPERFRPLPDRVNIVVTRQTEWNADGALTAESADEAIELAGDRAVWIIGGAEIFARVIQRADRLEVTEIRADVDGDTFAPPIDASWRPAVRDPETGWHTSRTGLDYRFIRYERG
ncbi:MAG: dihydrofolate reductase [Microbacteriaceae bacterium]|nr:dihydrofolate reductase [Microbacteriaceae bacterium]